MSTRSAGSLNPGLWVGATAAVLTATAVVVGQQLHVVSGTPVAPQPTITLSAGPGGELPVTLPALPGWVPVFLEAASGSYPSDRGLITNPGLQDKGYAPTIIVTVDMLKRPDQAGQEYARTLTKTLGMVSTVVEIGDRDVCGRTAYLTEFTGMADGPRERGGQSGTSITVVPDGGGYAYIAILQTRDTDNPGYRKQRDAMLSGFCIGN